MSEKQVISFCLWSERFVSLICLFLLNFLGKAWKKPQKFRWVANMT